MIRNLYTSWAATTHHDTEWEGCMIRHTPANAVATAVEMAESAWPNAWEFAEEMDVT